MGKTANELAQRYTRGCRWMEAGFGLCNDSRDPRSMFAAIPHHLQWGYANGAALHRSCHCLAVI